LNNLTTKTWKLPNYQTTKLPSYQANKLTKTALPFAAVALLAAQPLQAATTFYDDFSTDPNIGSEWTEYVYYDTADNVTTTWNSGDQDLDFVSTAGSAANTSVIGLYRDGSSRSATDPVTLTVNAFSQTGGTWGQVGLMIGDTAEPGLLDSNEKYEWHINYTGSGYDLRARKDVGTGSYELFNENLGASFSSPVKLDIVRNGANYEFYANDVLKWTASSYSSGVHDTFVNYQITMGGDGPATATIDNFGVAVPEPSTTALLGLGGLALILRRRK
jgi:hypothetical protein